VTTLIRRAAGIISTSSPRIISTPRGQRDICALNNANVERIKNDAIRSAGWLEAAVNGDYPTGTSVDTHASVMGQLPFRVDLPDGADHSASLISLSYSLRGRRIRHGLSALPRSLSGCRGLRRWNFTRAERHSDVHRRAA
jgi:hypothetical protein